MKAQEIRDQFTQFFIKKNHEKIPSSSLMPVNDNTLLFANAGMNQFKDYFTGKAVPENSRATTIQKCVRAGGKHNDLENVGMTARHHTFFEMLGNFSFGDYFKEEAISYSWELLTKVFNIPEHKLFITIHQSDDEALKIWHEKIGIPKDRIFRKGDKDNFWEMGEFGPCGPCSEIFFDHGELYSTPNLVLKKGQDLLDDEQRYVEIWNLVFMQYEKTPDGRLELPKPSIDTGSGLERLTAVLQGKYWNYDTDLFAPIIEAIEKLTKKKYDDPQYTSSMRIVADHIRACSMLITDGVLPSNEGRGYVLRRIARRAIRHLKDLNAPAVSFYKLVPSFFTTLEKEYPQNKANQALAEKLLKLEEEKFLETLELGIKYLEEAVKNEVIDNILPGKSAFKLYDTYGFPIDLTEIILREKGISLDQVTLEKIIQEHKEESKKTWKGGAGIDNEVFFKIVHNNGTTEFINDTQTAGSSTLTDIVDLEDYLGLVFDKTPFYGESGGQVGDIGAVEKDGKVIAHIIDTQKPIPDLHIHLIKKAEGLKLEIGQQFQLVIDLHHRKLVARNHSATHLLQAALYQTLGHHIKQAGSLVNAEKLRFDFTHPQALTSTEIEVIEKLVNTQIQTELIVSDQQMTMDEALNEGALALFGEKYGKQVRVLRMGKFSTELCGGTHVNNTADIGIFTIITETSLSTGVRRIEAMTSEGAINRLQVRSQILKEIEELTQTKHTEISAKIALLIDSSKQKLKQIEQLRSQLQIAKSGELFANKKELNGNVFCISETDSSADLRQISDMYLSKYPKGVLLAYNIEKERMNIILRASKNIKSINCSNILKNALTEINGRGGGRQDMAQGSGEKNNIDVFINKIKEQVEHLL